MVLPPVLPALFTVHLVLLAPLVLSMAPHHVLTAQLAPFLVLLVNLAVWLVSLVLMPVCLVWLCVLLVPMPASVELELLHVPLV